MVIVVEDKGKEEKFLEELRTKLEKHFLVKVPLQEVDKVVGTV